MIVVDSTVGPAIQLQQKQGISDIPAEIFHEIFSYLEPDVTEYKSSVDMTTMRNRTIYSMALVCRHFYHYVFPILFEKVFTSGPGPLSNKKGILRGNVFCKSVADGDEHARMIATYTKKFAIVNVYIGMNFKSAPFPKTSPGAEQDLTTFSNALAYMSNLQELYLVNLSITDDFLRSAVYLPPLKELRLEHCNVPKSLDPELLTKFSTKVQVHHVRAEQQISLTDSVPYDQFTSYLCMSRTHLFTSDIGVESHILRGLAASTSPMQYMQNLYLESIHINRAHPELLPSVLAVMPALKYLYIGEVDYCRSWGINIKPPGSTPYPKLPHLVHIHAPFYTVQALVPDSNSASVGFSREWLDKTTGSAVRYGSDTNFWYDCAMVLYKSKYCMSRLDIPVAFYSVISFEEFFPELQILTLRTAHCNWRFGGNWEPEMHPQKTVTEFLKLWDTHPRLDTLNFIFRKGFGYAPTRIKLPDKTRKLLKKKIPTLKELSFSYYDSDLQQYVDLRSFVLD